MKALALIDLQNDFIDGSLAVGSEKFYASWENTKKLAANEKFDFVLATMDYHPQKHCSFKESGGIWPDHCVASTSGCALNKDVLAFLNSTSEKKIEKGEDYPYVLLKGKNLNEEEYGVNLLDASRYGTEEAKEAAAKIYEIHVVGLCTDYCVKNCAIETAKKNADVKIFVHTSCSVAINPDEKIDFSEFPNIQIVE